MYFTGARVAGLQILQPDPRCDRISVSEYFWRLRSIQARRERSIPRIRQGLDRRGARLFDWSKTETVSRRHSFRPCLDPFPSRRHEYELPDVPAPMSRDR